jgi:ParB-like chromosome segregation protein Spo0J
MSQELEQIATASLIPYARNSRTHSDEQVAQIMASIREFGFTNPVLIDEVGTIIAGHGRVLAATRMELEHVPCLRLTHLTEAQKRAYVIADNKLALNAEWDSELLSVELQNLLSDNFDLSFLGFEEHELDPLLAADWSPADVADMPTVGEGDNTEGHAIQFSDAQWETVLPAIAKCREVNDDADDLTSSECVELVCKTFLQ